MEKEKFDGLIGEPIGSPFINDDQREICSRFANLSGNRPGWNYASISYHIDANGNIDCIEETKVYSTGEEPFCFRLEK